MAKRTAASELTDRNWDHEDEPEEAGEFSKASDDTIKHRQIIKAKRRNDPSQQAKTAFTGFGGFAFKPTQTSTPLLGFGGTKTESKIPAQDKRPAEPTTEEGSPAKQQKTESNGSDKNGDSSPYLTSLRSLNESVLKWISQHVDKNPYCILTPIFRDYEKHLAELEKDKGKSDTSDATESKKPTDLKTEESAKTMDTAEQVKPVPKSGLTFGLGNLKASSVMGAPPVFAGFGFKSSDNSTGASPFSFAVGKTSQVPSTSGSAAGDSKDEEEYVPPKPEVLEHQEEGSLYNKRCKLFYQKDGAWAERGLGQLHLKEIDGKGQLVVRADTTLGNILLNILLSSSIPMSRSGKNNVSLMCIPNPAIPKVPDNKAIPMLIRVKTAEDADELLEKMKDLQS